MAFESESGHVVCSAQRGTRLARTLFVSRRSKAQLIRTAVYGTVRTVVWEGRMSNCPPYPDQDWLPHVYNRGVFPMRLAALFLFLALFAGLLGAQESTGSIIGRIFDPTGSAISGAEVTATQAET